MNNNFSPDCVTFRRRDFDAALDRHSQINNGRARRIIRVSALRPKSAFAENWTVLRLLSSNL